MAARVWRFALCCGLKEDISVKLRLEIEAETPELLREALHALTSGAAAHEAKHVPAPVGAGAVPTPLPEPVPEAVPDPPPVHKPVDAGAVPAPVPEAVPAAAAVADLGETLDQERAKSFEPESIKELLRELFREGKRTEIQQLLAKYKASTFPDLDAGHYKAFYTELLRLA
jgi:hypothetical protein